MSDTQGHMLLNTKNQLNQLTVCIPAGNPDITLILYSFISTYKFINKHKCPGEVGVQTVMLVKGKTVGHIL